RSAASARSRARGRPGGSDTGAAAPTGSTRCLEFRSCLPLLVALAARESALEPIFEIDQPLLDPLPAFRLAPRRFRQPGDRRGLAAPGGQLDGRDAAHLGALLLRGPEQGGLGGELDAVGHLEM